jgi:multidrug efflux pump
MMASRLLRTQERHGRVYLSVEHFFERMTAGYSRNLARALTVRWVVVLIGLVVAGSSVLLFTSLRSELAPSEDRGFVLGIAIAPEGATLDFTEKYARRIEDIFARVPEVQQYFVVTGFPVVNQAITFAPLKPWEERQRTSQQIIAEIAPRFFAIPGVLAFPINPPSLGASATAKPVQFVVQTSGSYTELQQMVDKLMAEARNYPGLQNLDTDLKLNKPELRLNVNRDKALGAGYEVATIGRTFETLLGGRQVTRFKREGKQYDVILQLADENRNTPSDIKDIYLPTRGGNVVPIENFIEITERVAPRELNHFNKLRAATITATLGPGYTLGDGITFLEDATRRLLPAATQIDYAGEAREFRTSSGSLYFSFVLALAFIYLVLAAQFESFVDPLIIMLTVPLSMTGALLALKLSGGTLNVYSQIGLVTLIGLITKHGILIVEFANQLQAQGRSIRDAVIESAVLRLRPILMTTGAMVLGSVPLAIATGAGAESRQQIGWVIVGGLLLGTLLTLFVVPTAYTFMARRHAPAPDETAAAVVEPQPTR